jgi:L-threonylcarbamoyladenylate synthase
MTTDLVEIDPQNPPENVIERAANSIRRGDVVAIPTEALYALVADPFNLHAVGQVFLAKGREPHRSLPLLVSDLLMAEDLAKELTARFYALARRFWPGPLTIIVPAAAKVPLRQSRAVVAGALLEKTGQALIATSANISGQPTCRSGIQVFGVMDGRVDLILDGGLCSGAGSTTIDVTEPAWKIIREGGIPEKDIRECLGGVE